MANLEMFLDMCDRGDASPMGCNFEEEVWTWNGQRNAFKYQVSEYCDCGSNSTDKG